MRLAICAMSTSTSSNEQKKLSLRLTRAARHPRLALEKRWFEDPAFCQGFFDRVDDLAFVMSRDTLELARRAVEIAERNGDPHLINRSLGVLSHGYIAACDYYWAGRALREARRRALACCPRCRHEHLRREGDLLGELREVPESLAALNHALEEGKVLDADARARTLFIRSISWYHDGARGRAIADVGGTLAGLSLTSPRGYLVDAVALLAVFAKGGGPKDDRAALAHVEHVLGRIRGLEGRSDLRVRSAWAKGHFHARLGDVRRARDQLELAVRHLLEVGLAREAVAAVLDLAQLRCRHPEPREDGIRLARREIQSCLTRRADMPDALREGLEEMVEVLEVYPEGAFDRMVDFRSSFITSVPGLLGERIGCR